MPVSPTQLPALVAELGLTAQVEGYERVPQVAPLIFKQGPQLSLVSPPLGDSGVVISGGKIPQRIQRGQAAPSGTLDQVQQWFRKIHKYARSIEIQEEMYNSPNAMGLISELIGNTAAGWGEGWAQAREQFAASFFNKGVLAAGYADTFDGSHPGRVDTYPAFIYDGKPFFAASGNGHPLGLASATLKHNLIVSAALNSTTLDAARILIEDTNAVDEAGDKISLRPNVLLVPPGLEQTAHVLLETMLKPGTAQNDKNWISNDVIRPVKWRFLTDSDGWFLGQAQEGIEMSTSGDQLRITASAPDKDTGTVTVRCVGYMGAVVKNWRPWAAMNLATS